MQWEDLAAYIALSMLLFSAHNRMANLNILYKNSQHKWRLVDGQTASLPRMCSAACDRVVRALDPVGKASSGLRILHLDCMSVAEGSLASATTAL